MRNENRNSRAGFAGKWLPAAIAAIALALSAFALAAPAYADQAGELEAAAAEAHPWYDEQGQLVADVHEQLDSTQTVAREGYSAGALSAAPSAALPSNYGAATTPSITDAQAAQLKEIVLEAVRNGELSASISDVGLNMGVRFSPTRTQDATAVSGKYYFSLNGDGSYAPLSLAVGTAVPANSYEETSFFPALYSWQSFLIKDVLTPLIEDRYEMFYISAFSASAMYSGTLSTIQIYTYANTDRSTESTVRAAEKATFNGLQASLDTAKKSAQEWIPSDGTELQKAKAAHDWLVRNTNYNDYANDNYSNSTEWYRRVPHSAYGALVRNKPSYGAPSGDNGDPVCDGYSYAMQAMLEDYGMNVLMVVHTATTYEPAGHAWNLIQIDGKWYNFDVTWDESATTPSTFAARPNTGYFAKSNTAWASMYGGSGYHANGHRADSRDELPAATSTIYDGVKDTTEAPYYDVYQAPYFQKHATYVRAQSAVVPVGMTTRLEYAALHPEDFDHKSRAQWTSSDPSIARIVRDSEGYLAVEGVRTGSATLSLSIESGVSDPLYSTSEVTVSPATTSVQFLPNGAPGQGVSVPAVPGTDVALLDSATFEREGYRFVEWNTSADGSGTHYAVPGSYHVSDTAPTGSSYPLFAIWERLSYTVRFMGENGSLISSQSVSHGDAASAPNVPSVTGKYFVEWDKAFSNIAGDLVVTAKYAPVSYTVTYEPNAIFDYGTILIASQEFTYHEDGDYDENGNGLRDGYPLGTRPNYMFAGWNTKADGTGRTYQPGDKPHLTNSNGSTVTLYAVWSDIVFHVKFIDEDGSTIVVRDVQPGGSVVPPTAPAPAGKVFDHWTSSDNVRYGQSSIVENVRHDLDITCHYRTIVFSVHYNPNAGAGITLSPGVANQDDIEWGSEPYVRDGYPLGSREGYRFVNWNTQPNGTGATYTPSEKAVFANVHDGDVITLYAQWAIDTTANFTVTFVNADGTTITSYKVERGTTITNPPTPKDVEGKHFTGWDNSLTNITADVTFKALFQANSYTIAYMPNATGVTATVSPQSQVYGSETALRQGYPLGSRTGYVFKNWNTKADGSGTTYQPGAITRIPAADGSTVTLYAQWTASTFTVTFLNASNATIATRTVLYGQSAPAPVAPTVSGKVFAGWDKPIYNITADTTVKATYRAVAYTVRYDSNGASAAPSIADQAQQVGSEKALSAGYSSSARPGYSFSHWNTRRDGRGTSYAAGEKAAFSNVLDGAVITLYAQWRQSSSSSPSSSSSSSSQSSSGNYIGASGSSSTARGSAGATSGPTASRGSSSATPTSSSASSGGIGASSSSATAKGSTRATVSSSSSGRTYTSGNYSVSTGSNSSGGIGASSSSATAKGSTRSITVSGNSSSASSSSSSAGYISAGGSSATARRYGASFSVVSVSDTVRNLAEHYGE